MGRGEAVSILSRRAQRPMSGTVAYRAIEFGLPETARRHGSGWNGKEAVVAEAVVAPARTKAVASEMPRRRETSLVARRYGPSRWNKPLSFARRVAGE